MKDSILVVDDDRALLDGFTRAFRKDNFRVVTAQSGHEALELLKGIKVGVIVADQQMPGLTGIELLTVVAKKCPDTVRIMLTGNATIDTAIQAINEGGVYRFFKKPYDHSELGSAIRTALQERTLIAHSRRLVEVLEMQSSYIESLEKEHPGITKLNKSEEGAIILEDSRPLDEVLAEIRQELDIAETRLAIKRKIN